MLRMLGYAGHAEKPVSLFATSAGPACKLFAQHAASMLRVLDAKTFRGDVSEKLQVRSASSHYLTPPDESNTFIRTLLTCYFRSVTDVLSLWNLAL